MRNQGIQPTPASHHNSGHDSRNKRCGGCGFAWNGYVWSSCPKCTADDRRQYALRCRSCRTPFFATERVELCPDCGSGDTVVIAEPSQPAVR